MHTGKKVFLNFEEQLAARCYLTTHAHRIVQERPHDHELAAELNAAGVTGAGKFTASHIKRFREAKLEYTTPTGEKRTLEYVARRVVKPRGPYKQRAPKAHTTQGDLRTVAMALARLITLLDLEVPPELATLCQTNGQAPTGKDA